VTRPLTHLTKELFEISNRLLVQLDALVETIMTVIVILIANSKKAKKEYDDAFAKLQSLADGDSPDIDGFWSEHKRFEVIRNVRNKAEEALRMFPQSLFVSMVSQFDAFFSSASRTLFLLRPEKIRSGDRSITVAELVKHKTIEDALVELVNDEVDEVLRGSHIEQLEWISKTFDFKIDPKTPLVERFIEITERRNICVHSDGRVSKQYLERCKNIDQALVAQEAIGKWVVIGPTYLRSARDVLFEIGFRSIQIAWRKARPDQKKQQSKMLKDTGIELLKREDYDLAKNLYAFALELRDLTDQDRKHLAINSAIAHKFSGSEETANKILDAIDWSASESKYKMAVAVIREDYPRVISLMSGVPTEGEGSVSAKDYRQWPLFKAIRNDVAFATAFKEKFGESLQGEIERIMENESQLVEKGALGESLDSVQPLPEILS
jgi:hypothetical protein